MTPSLAPFRDCARDDLNMAKMGETLREKNESLMIKVQNSAIRINFLIKTKINNTQQNSKYRLCGDRDETVNHIISECSKLAQKEHKNRQD